MMKMFLLAFYVYFSASSFSQAQPIADSVAKRCNISRVTRIFKHPFQKTIYTDYYGKTGQLVKSEKINDYEKEKTVTAYKYQHGLLINALHKTYCEGKLCETQKTVYTYNKENRLTGSTTFTDTYAILKDTIIYNDAMNMDIIHSYSNDTSIYNPGRRSYDTRLVKNLHERQVTINYYDSAKNKLKQINFSYDNREGCMHSHRPPPLSDSTGYTITEFYVSGDTTIKKIKSWTCRESTSLYKSVNVSRNETYEYTTFNGYGGDTTRTIDKFNKLNLISTRNVSTIQNGYSKPQLSVVTYQYFYYPKR